MGVGVEVGVNVGVGMLSIVALTRALIVAWMSGRGVGVGEGVGVGVGAGKVVGVSPVPTVESEEQLKRATQTTGKIAKGIQRFMEKIQTAAGLNYCSAALLTKASSSSLVETSPSMRALRSRSNNSPTRGPSGTPRRAKSRPLRRGFTCRHSFK